MRAIMHVHPPLPLGYSQVPPGHLATMVTCLEMTTAPALAPGTGLGPAWSLVPLDRQDLAAYRELFRKVGADWLWDARLVMADDALAAILADPQVLSFALCQGAERLGMLELDFRQAGQGELAYFGLAAEAIGKGLGRSLMNEALAIAWARPISRFWVHTCSFDHPSALAFYIRSGFRPYATMVELMTDPRLEGRLPINAAPHVPLIQPPTV
jgi:GNAT superfamily N-acetyltransferase